jgi:hypothetical protein
MVQLLGWQLPTAQRLVPERLPVSSQRRGAADATMLAAPCRVLLIQHACSTQIKMDSERLSGLSDAILAVRLKPELQQAEDR